MHLINVADVDAAVLVEKNDVLLALAVDGHVELVLVGVRTERLHDERVQTSRRTTDLQFFFAN